MTKSRLVVGQARRTAREHSFTRVRGAKKEMTRSIKTRKGKMMPVHRIVSLRAVCRISALLLMFVAACGGDDSSGPPDAIIGEYAWARWNDLTLGGTTELNVRASGVYSVVSSAGVQMGEWERRGSGYRFRPDPGPQLFGQFDAVLRADSIIATDPVMGELAFARRD